MTEGNDISAMLDLRAGDVVGIVGAGGKTTTMYRICHELRARGLRVVSTTTTAIQRPTPAQSPLLVIAEEASDLVGAVEAGLGAYLHVTVVGSTRRADKFEGVSAATVTALQQVADVVVIEADGARHAAIKAPAEHEPSVPGSTTVFLSVVGLHALGHPLMEVCHRPERAALLTGQPTGTAVTADTLARLLASMEGGLRGMRDGARAWAVLTHMKSENAVAAHAIARAVLPSGYRGVIGLSREGVARLA